jgi:hypothetical protein
MSSGVPEPNGLNPWSLPWSRVRFVEDIEKAEELRRARNRAAALHSAANVSAGGLFRLDTGTSHLSQSCPRTNNLRRLPALKWMPGRLSGLLTVARPSISIDRRGKERATHGKFNRRIEAALERPTAPT